MSVLHLYCICITLVLHLSCICIAHVLHLDSIYICTTSVLHLNYICTTSALHLYYICITSVLHLHYICTTSVLHLCYICITFNTIKSYTIGRCENSNTSSSPSRVITSNAGQTEDIEELRQSIRSFIDNDVSLVNSKLFETGGRCCLILSYIDVISVTSNHFINYHLYIRSMKLENNLFQQLTQV